MNLGVNVQPTTEHVVLVDELDREIGVMEKLMAHRKAALHRAFSVFVFNAQNQMLLQKRATGKYHSGGLWSNAACGHPRPRESTFAAARRRMREEMGFECDLVPAFNFIYRAPVGDDLWEHEFDHVLIGEYSGVIAPDPQEAESWRWVSRHHLMADLLAHPDDYTFWFKNVIQQVGEIAGEKFR